MKSFLLPGGTVDVTSFMTSRGGGSSSLRGLSRSDVDVHFDPERFARKSDGQPQEDAIEANWREKIRMNPNLFNGDKFRLARMAQMDSGRLSLQVGLTTYKEMLGTHYATNRDQLLAAAGASGLDRYAFMSNAMGVGCHTLTSDSYIVLMRRSSGGGGGGEWPGAVDRPGGHPEPELAVKSANAQSMKELSAGDVLKEIFASPASELRDEINVPLEMQLDPELLGRARDLSCAGRFGFEFLVKVKLTKDEVQQRYLTGQQSEAYESDSLIFHPLSRVTDWEFSEAELSSMAPQCLGGLHLLHLRLTGEFPSV